MKKKNFFISLIFAFCFIQLENKRFFIEATEDFLIRIGTEF